MKNVLFLIIIALVLCTCDVSDRSVLLNSSDCDIRGVYFAHTTDTFDCYIESTNNYLLVYDLMCTDSAHADFQDFDCFGEATHLYPAVRNMYYSTINNTLYLYADSLKTIPIICNGSQLSISILDCQLEYQGIVYSKQ